MRKQLVVLTAVTALTGIGVAVAAHVAPVDPATVPTGFLAAHNDVGNFRVHTIVRAVRNEQADVFVQHVRLGPNAATGWHTHPGPAIVTIVGEEGSLTYQDAHTTQCRSETFTVGQGFVDPGFGHVHRAIAGPEGVDFYVTYILPSGSEGHVIPTPAPAECSS